VLKPVLQHILAQVAKGASFEVDPNKVRADIATITATGAPSTAAPVPANAQQAALGRQGDCRRQVARRFGRGAASASLVAQSGRARASIVGGGGGGV
jgi:hypothetical protein